MKVDNIRKTSFDTSLYKPSNDEGLSVENSNDSIRSLSSPFSNPYKPTKLPANNYSGLKSNGISTNTKGKTAAERNNNPFNIKFGKFASKYGATKENRNALDGGSFATFPTVDAGLEAAKDLLLGNGYRNLTVDAAMKRWSNKGYGGNIYPEIANKRIGELSPIELDALQKKQIVQEDRNYAKKLGFFKYGGKIPTYEIGGLTPRSYSFGSNPLSTGLQNYTSPTALNTVINNNKGNGFGAGMQQQKPNNGVNTVGLASMGLGLVGSGLEMFDTNPKKVNKGAATGAGALKGAGVGASVGGTLGTIVPGVGNVVGGAVGAVGGAIVGGVTSFIKAKKRQKLIDQSVANNQRNFNQGVQDRSTSLYAQLNPYQYKLGGTIDDKKPVKKSELTPKQFYNSYLKSANFEKRALETRVEDPQELAGERLRNINKLKVTEKPSKTGSIYLFDKNEIKLDPRDYDGYNVTKDNVLGHEFGHAAGALKPSKTIAKELTMNRTEEMMFDDRRKYRPGDKSMNDLPVKKMIDTIYSSQPSEAKADMDALRFRLKKDGIYDTGTQEFKIEHLKEAKKKYHDNRFLKNYKDEDILYLMNNIASNNKPDNNIFKAKYGGNLYEAEKNEVVQGDAQLEDGKQIARGLHLVGGKTHENGGTLGMGGDRVFSNSISFKGKTVAGHAKQIGNKLAKFEKMLSSKDNMKRKTAEIMTDKLTGELDNVFNTQEEMKAMGMYKYGGYIKQYATGGDLREEKKEAIRRRIKTLDKYLNENPKRQAIGGYDAKDALRREKDTLEKQLNNKMIWEGGSWNPLDKNSKQLLKPKSTIPLNGQQQTDKDIAWTKDLNPVTIKGKRPIASPSKNKIGNITARNQFNIPNINNARTGINTLDPLAGGLAARANEIGKPTGKLASNNSPLSSTGERNEQTSNFDPLLATGLGLSGIGYLNSAANINRMETDVPVNLNASPYYGYRDRSRLARHDLNASANTILRNPNVSAGQKQAIFSRLSGGINQINDQENQNRFQYDNEFNHRSFITNAQNNAMLNQSVQQRIANKNAQLGLRSQNFNSLLGNVNTSLAEQQKRKLDERRMNIIAQTYKRNYGTDFDIPE